ncbi:MAG TPA: symmetrical bis(5'-nucleosyl)-tetraphosphatase [Steroidobacteraceae bacterium]|nr:symmetrical bis(5'-nucleosyl)-tetraphosphatase [Steroidobacteraceae bacterium]
MTRFAIGDVQGCHDELRALLQRSGFSADRDRLWFVGDLVNRGPHSLEVLRYVRALGDNAIVVLGNHDLHLLALALGSRRRSKPGDTLDAVLAAPDRDALLEWLLGRPLASYDAAANDLLVHGGVIPQWTVDDALALSGEVQAALARDPRTLFDEMYGNRPDRWSPDLAGIDRLRFAINTFTRMRYCTAGGRIDLARKEAPGLRLFTGGFRPWFKFKERRTRTARVVFGHWSTLGFYRGDGVVGLDTGCVWGGSLTALDLDRESTPVSVGCGAYQAPGE